MSVASELPGPSSPEMASAMDETLGLRNELLAHLREQGFRVSENERTLLMPVDDGKESLRNLHQNAVKAQRERSKSGLASLEPKFLRRLASGGDVVPTDIRPALHLLAPGDHFDAKLWRWASLHWSVPVSSGYGRRMRFLVVDEAHDGALMGLIGLADPVFALTARDGAIGWDAEDRRYRLANVMDAYVLGAVPPYSMLLGGKLLGLLLSSVEVREAFESRYGESNSRILGRATDAQLALVTTSSALGRSSIYNRVWRQDGSSALARVGYTRGTGDFHFSGDIYDKLASLAQRSLGEGATHRHEKWGEGFRNRREVVQRALRELGLSPTNFRLHGVRREVFLSELALNSREWLLTGEGDLRWRAESVTQLGSWWRHRWAEPRARSQIDWATFAREQWTLWPKADPLVSET